MPINTEQWLQVLKPFMPGYSFSQAKELAVIQS